MGKKEKPPVKRVVLDTNVLVSALLFRGELSRMVAFWKNGGIVPVFSKETFAEFRAVLEYPKFSLTQEERRALIEEEVLAYSEVVELPDRVQRIGRDPDDDKFIACALAGGADTVVSGDKDLLDIGKYGSVRIISPRAFLKKF